MLTESNGKCIESEPQNQWNYGSPGQSDGSEFGNSGFCHSEKRPAWKKNESIRQAKTLLIYTKTRVVNFTKMYTGVIFCNIGLLNAAQTTNTNDSRIWWQNQ